MPLPLLFTLLSLDDTPAKTVQGFIDAFNARDTAGITRRVVGQKTGFPVGVELPPFKATVGATKIDGDTATVEVEMDAPFKTGTRNHETVNLRLIAGDWQIVPRDPRAPGATRGTALIGAFAFLTSNPELFFQAKKAAVKTQSLSKVKRIALAAKMYANDHKDRMPRATNFRASVAPYLKDADAFTVPGLPRGTATYFLDPRLSGRLTTSLSRPAETAMVLLGSPKETLFPYGGQTILGYADGHVKAATPEVVAKARKTALQ